jgi:hypothetical protein
MISCYATINIEAGNHSQKVPAHNDRDFLLGMRWIGPTNLAAAESFSEKHRLIVIKKSNDPPLVKFDFAQETVLIMEKNYMLS